MELKRGKRIRTRWWIHQQRQSPNHHHHNHHHHNHHYYKKRRIETFLWYFDWFHTAIAWKSVCCVEFFASRSIRKHFVLFSLVTNLISITIRSIFLHLAPKATVLYGETKLRKKKQKLIEWNISARKITLFFSTISEESNK